MSAHLNSSGMARYLARSLPPDELVSLHAHLETCADCRGLLEEAALTTPLLFPLLLEETEPHLSEEEMVAFVAGRLPVALRADAARHLAACELCRDSVGAMEEVAAAESVRSRPHVRWFGVGAVIASALAAALMIVAVMHFRRAGPPVAPAAPVLASLRDSGRVVELESDGVLRGVENATPEERNLIRDALERRKLPPGPDFPGEKSGVLLAPGNGAPAPFSLLAPLGTRVLSDRPVFVWQPYPGAAAYQVLVTSESLDPLARSGRIAATEWRAESPLPRGVVLLWQVRAWHGGEMVSAPAPPAPPARFEIAGAQVAARIEQLRAAPHPSHLLAAVICAREGLPDDAAKEIQALARENPDSLLVRSLSGGQ